MTSLKIKAASGIKWQVVNKISQKVISVATFAFLARIMEPAVFGLFALAFVVIDSLQFFKSFGLDSALIQRQEDDEFRKALDTAFIVIQLNGIVLCSLCFMAAPFVASYFKSPQLLGITRALGLIFIFTCFSKIPNTLLQKRMRFNTIAVIEFISSIINAVVAIMLAILMQNVWSLVIAYLVKQAFISIVSWYYSGFRFSWKFEWGIAKELFQFGKYLMGMSVLWFINGKLNNIIVGKMLGVSLLGFLVLAENIGNFINTHFTALISGVMFPAYSSIQHEKEALKRVYLKTIKYVSFFSAPFAIYLICFAEQFTHVLYGDQWYEIIPLVKVFGIIQLVSPITWCSGALFMGCGRPNYSFNVTLVNICLRVPLIIYSISQWGLIGAVLAGLVLTLTFAPINLWLVKSLVGFEVKEFWKALAPAYMSALICFISIQIINAATAHYAQGVVFTSAFFQITAWGGGGLAIYAFCLYKTDAVTFLDIKSMLFNKNKI